MSKNKFYQEFPNKIAKIKAKLNRPLTLTEKILYGHLFEQTDLRDYKKGMDYADFAPDRVAMQDATAQMALLQFIEAKKNSVALPVSLHCDHLIKAECDSQKDLAKANLENKEVYDFLASVSQKFGIDYWQPGSGIIHQIVLENYAFPGGLMIGTDSHTPTAGGLGMIAIGVGGADAVDVMVGMPWELNFPKVLGVKLIGKLGNWTSAKDVILYLTGLLTVKGGTGFVVEYFGPGTETLSATGKATICNMGAEIGATSSVFPYDQKMRKYLIATNRSKISDVAEKIKDCLSADPEVYLHPNKYYDQVLEINLSELEPYINGPFTPDKAWKISEFAKAVEQNNFPEKLSVGLIGSCTNSSYEDMSRCASLSKQVKEKALKIESEFLISPGSEQIYETIKNEGILADFENLNAQLLTNSCGPCIGQWLRAGMKEQPRNSIVTSFNRNFAKRNDGNPNTYTFLAAPEIVTALTMAGSLKFNPLKDEIVNKKGQKVKLDAPKGDELPKKGFAKISKGLIKPAKDGCKIQINISPDSDRLQLLTPFAAWDGKNLADLKLLIKVKGKCTTDHISMAGPWLKYRGHLDKISNNLLISAENAFNHQTNKVKNQLTREYDEVPQAARFYLKENKNSIIIAEDNYGEGSSREHAALEPRYLGVKAVIVKSFARIHETNLKKQGILALTFAQKSDYDKIHEDDHFDLSGLTSFQPNKPLILIAHHQDGTKDKIKLNHSYSKSQIAWFKAGSALNYLNR